MCTNRERSAAQWTITKWTRLCNHRSVQEVWCYRYLKSLLLPSFSTHRPRHCPASPKGHPHPDFLRYRVVLSVFERPMNGIICFTLCLASFSQPVVGFIHAVKCSNPCFFSPLCSILLRGPITCVKYVLSVVDGPLGYWLFWIVPVCILVRVSRCRGHTHL